MIKDYNKTAIVAGERNVSYKEMIQYIRQYAQASHYDERAHVIIFSENREEWIYAFFSVWNNHGIAVPVDATSTVSDVAYILNDCRPSFIWTSSKNVATVQRALKETNLDIPVALLDLNCVNTNVTVSEKDEPWLEGDETAIIIYTSGTTGSPKGVMLSYDNLYANMNGVSKEVPIYNEHRRALILLPVHHVLPLMGCVIAPILVGGGVAISPSMTGPDIMDTMQRGQVGIFIGVPRLWQILYGGIMKKINASAVTRGLYNMCAKANSPALSRVVFSSIRKMMGGHIDFCVSGGAALDPQIGHGLQILGLNVLEGYGMTETAPIIAFTRPGDYIPGCSGKPLPSVECKLVNGELCAKGPNVMKGYYNRPEETAAVIDKDGFIHTGDLATIDEKGRVTITGRTKEIIVLSNGKNVQPYEIEFRLDRYDEQIKECAITEKDDMLLAIIVPQDAWAEGKTDAEIEEQLKREIIEPYNKTVENYKKVMRLFVYHGDLPRTKLDKIQRFKLKDIINGSGLTPALSQGEGADGNADAVQTDADDSLLEEFKILKNYIEQEKKLPVTPQSHIETDLAFDSLDKVGLQGFIEDTFGMKVNADNMAGFRNIQEMAEHIHAEKTRMEVGDTDWHKILNDDREQIELPSTSVTYPLSARTFKAYFKMHNRLTVKGKENIPQSGPFILAPNHQSVLDGPLAVTGMPWSLLSDCYFYATEEHVQHPVLRYLAKRNNIILMEKSNLKTSIQKLARVLRQGKIVVIFPEGSRTHTGAVGEYKKMFAILSKELNVPILPARIDGAFESLPRGKRIPNSHPLCITYMPVIQPTENMTYEKLAEQVRNATMKD